MFKKKLCRDGPGGTKQRLTISVERVPQSSVYAIQCSGVEVPAGEDFGLKNPEQRGPYEPVRVKPLHSPVAGCGEQFATEKEAIERVTEMVRECIAIHGYRESPDDPDSELYAN
ncbi:MAG: hypothetical protein ACRD2P_17710 [Terriglobia bacterium]